MNNQIVNQSHQISTFSKWLSLQVLLDESEMQALLEELGDFYIFSTGVIYPEGQGEISKEAFLNCYAHYVNALKSGLIPEEVSYRSLFSVIFTQNQDHVFSMKVGQGKQLIRVAKPIVQLQQHRLHYSKADEKFYPMVFALDSILWGIQFSYPQLYQNGTTKEISKVTDTEQFPNTQLFRKIQLWLRHHTIPTPFQLNGKKINVPVRLGKKCLSWINQHPQLIMKNIQVQS